MENKTFINGFQSWQETHFEIVSFITNPKNINNPIIDEVIKHQGTGGLYELAEELTDEFESISKNKEWDGDFFDEIELFLLNKF